MSGADQSGMATNVIGPSSGTGAGYGSPNGGGTWQWIYNTGLLAGQFSTFHVVTNPSNYEGTVNFTISLKGGGTIEQDNVQVKPASTCKPEDPQGPGQLDTVCPSGKKEEEEAKLLDVRVRVYDAASGTRLVSSFRKDEKAYFHDAVQNPNDDPVTGKFSVRMFGVQHIVFRTKRDVQGGLTREVVPSAVELR